MKSDNYLLGVLIMDDRLIKNENDISFIQMGVVSLLINIGIAYLYMSNFQGFDTSIQILLAFLITMVSFLCAPIHKFHIGSIILVISSIWYANFITGFGIRLFQYKNITILRTLAFIIAFIFEFGFHIFILGLRDPIIKKYKRIFRRE